jgi:fatty acid desaturase
MLKPLAAYQSGPYRPRRVAITALLLVAVLYLGSMPLHWVGVVTATGSYVIVSGIDKASWVVVAAAIVVAIAVRIMLAPPGGYMRFALLLLNFWVCLGLYIAYIDNQGRALSDTFTPYLGPGFFLALGATALLIAASVLVWRDDGD